MKKWYVNALAGAAMCLAIPGAAQELPPAAEVEVDYMKDIHPILEESCFECHNEETQKSGLRMDGRNLLLEGGVEGPSAVVGNSAESLMIHLIMGTNENYERMPTEGDYLTDEQVGLLRAWIDQGMDMPDAVEVKLPEKFEIMEQVKGLPADFRSEATNQEGPLSKWALVSDIQGPNGEQVIALTHPAPPNPGTFNLLWTPAASFTNGSIEVKVKSMGGEEDQGGGVIWRAKDKNNYYVARYNPLEKNFRFYKLVDGNREQIASVDTDLPADEWTTLKVDMEGNKFTGFINGEQVLEAEDDAHAGPGGVGYWTKADAATAFAGTKIVPR